MNSPERLANCPRPDCTPQARNQASCYGKNGCLRACLLVEGKPLLQWQGDEAWSGPSNWYAKEAAALKEEPK